MIEVLSFLTYTVLWEIALEVNYQTKVRIDYFFSDRPVIKDQINLVFL